MIPPLELQQHAEEQEEQDLGLPFRELCVEVKKLSTDLAENIQKELAEVLVESIATVYWSEVNATKKCDFKLLHHASKSKLSQHDKTTALLTHEIGKALATLSVEEASYQIGAVYTSLLPKSYRSRNGVFFTPPVLANRLLDQAELEGVDWATGKFLDPASGGGAFIVPMALRMLRALDGSNPLIVLKNIESRLHGWELDPFAAWLGNLFVQIACIDVSVEAKKLARPSISQKDSLSSKATRMRFDLIVGNPPFGRLRLSDEMRDRYREGLFGHANIYGLFTQLAVKLAKKGGLVSFLTPASFLAGEYFKNLRKILVTTMTPLQLDIVESRKDVFDGVLQETVLATYQKSQVDRHLSVAVIAPLTENQLSIAELGNYSLSRNDNRPWVLPHHKEDRRLAARLNDMPFRLSDWGYKVSTGPLVWNRHKDQLKTRKSKGCVPLVWAESISIDGVFKLRSEKRNHKPYIKLIPKKDDWLRVKTPCVLIQRTTSKEQSKRLIAAQLPSELIDTYGAVTVENHINMLVPCVKTPSVPATVVAAFLNSYATDRAFRCISGSVAVSSYELGAMPVPDPKKLAALKGLVTRRAATESLERACRKLYDMKEPL